MRGGVTRPYSVIPASVLLPVALPVPLLVPVVLDLSFGMLLLRFSLSIRFIYHRRSAIKHILSSSFADSILSLRPVHCLAEYLA